jgi:hypothetical protein
VVKHFRDITPESVTSATRRDTPTLSVIRIRPEEVTHRPFVRHFLDSINCPNMIESVDGWREPTMKTEYLIFHHSSEWKIIKEICIHLPDIATAILPNTFIEESIAARHKALREQREEMRCVCVCVSLHLSNLTTLMVATKNKNSFRKSNF